MAFLNTIPLIGALVAFLLGILILTSNGKNRTAKITLAVIVFMNVHNLFESYLFYNDLNWPGFGLGLSYLHYHLIGALFLLYTYLQFKIDLNLKLWGLVLGLYTLLRFAVLMSIDYKNLESAVDLTPELWGLIIDYFISVALNIVLLFLAFRKIQQLKFVVELTGKEQLNLKFLKSLLVISIAIYLAVLINSVISIFDEEKWLIYEKVESILISVFSVAIAYSAFRFPVFSVYGDFQDLSVNTQKKYAKSSLTEDAADKIWEELNDVMEDEKPYRNPEYRLNDLAARVNESVHHVSQVINEKQGISFSDFVNQFRVREAQKLLSSQRAKQITILAISFEAGFNSKTAFYNTFKKVTGKTPSEFKKTYETSNTD
ncbi:helix-turn-helix domain-containing protein [Fulvivirgaceae bacterium BMA10]|uniref:Helix-turn-helix domain-containing protein n=1 Tax=Splendidivirga corallicola TaxID=3051826 RepID=A0ABT8KPR6_9BACT|nr:helix-turn-helix domain-containing protein [Fulvivirgaceae bacterium BMA10]